MKLEREFSRLKETSMLGYKPHDTPIDRNHKIGATKMNKKATRG